MTPVLGAALHLYGPRDILSRVYDVCMRCGCRKIQNGPYVARRAAQMHIEHHFLTAKPTGLNERYGRPTRAEGLNWHSGAKT